MVRRESSALSVGRIGFSVGNRFEDQAKVSYPPLTPMRLSDPMRSADKPQSLSDARPIPRTADARSPSRFSRDRVAGATTQKNCTLSCGLRGDAAGAAPPWPQSKVRLCRPIKLTLGIENTKGRTTSVPANATIPDFHASRCAKRMKIHTFTYFPV